MRTVLDILDSLPDVTQPAVGIPSAGDRVYTYDQLDSMVTTLGGTLQSYGLSPESLVAIAPTARSEMVISTLAVLATGATVRVSPPAKAPVDAVVGPSDVVSQYIAPSDALELVYDTASDGQLDYKEAVTQTADTLRTTAVRPNTTALTDGEITATHADLAETVSSLSADDRFTTGAEVMIRAPLTDPRTIAAGVLTPLAAGCTLRPASGDGIVGDLAVTLNRAPEDRLFLIVDVPFDAASATNN